MKFILLFMKPHPIKILKRSLVGSYLKIITTLLLLFGMSFSTYSFTYCNSDSFQNKDDGSQSRSSSLFSGGGSKKNSAKASRTQSSRPDALRIYWNSELHPSLSLGETTEKPTEPTGSNSETVEIVLSEPVIFAEDLDLLEVYITGLMPGQSVLLEKFKVTSPESDLDENSILNRSYRLQDGVLTSVGGEYNLSIPGDFDDFPGEISVQLDLKAPELAHMPGNYIFRVSSPYDAFEPATTTFQILDSLATAEFSGVVTNQNGEPVPYAMVVLTNPVGVYSEYLAGTTADHLGRYRLPVVRPDDEFDVLAVLQGHVVSQTEGSSHYIEDWESYDLNLELVAGAHKVSGKLLDSQDPEVLMAGFEMIFMSLTLDGELDGEWLGVTWTEVDGTFETMLPPGRWGVHARAQSVLDRGYITTPTGVAAIIEVLDEAVEGIEVALEPATSMVHGQITVIDPIESLSDDPIPVVAVDVMAISEDGQLGVIGITDGNGDYWLPVTSGRWSVFPVSSSLWRQYYGGQVETQVDLPEEAAAFENDIRVRPSAGDAYAFMEDVDGSPLSKMRIYAYNTDPDVPEVELQYSYASDGFFCFGLPAGTWQIMPDPRELGEQGLLISGLPRVTFEELDFFDDYPAIEYDIRAIEPSGAIEVTVQDIFGTPLSDITLQGTLQEGGERYDTFGITDENGRAILPARAGSWIISASSGDLRSAGYQPILSTTVELNSPSANLNLLPIPFSNVPALLSSPVLDLNANELVVHGQGDPGQRYEIEVSSDLKNWQRLGNLLAVDGEFFFVQEQADQAVQKFVRATQTR